MQSILILHTLLIASAITQNIKEESAHVWDFQLNKGARQIPVEHVAVRALPTDAAETGANCAGPNTECVPYYKCDNQISSDNTGAIDLHLAETGPCSGSLDVCCAAENQSTDPPTSPTLRSTECGYRNMDGVGIRINGEKDNEAQFGEFPWMTAVLEKDLKSVEPKNLYLCGGSLIHPRVILTGAHCVSGKPNNILKVRLGEWDTQTTSEPLPYQDRDIVEVNIHPNYDSKVLINDVALLFLESPVNLAENVKPVCLPELGQNFDYRSCYATGWGKDRFGATGKYQAILKKVDLPVMPQEMCQTILRTTRLSQFFELHESFICAGGEKGKDTCRGDGGSPLVCPIPGNASRYYQAGIVAWGIGCGGDNVPGVYARVSHFRSWIDNELKEKGIDNKSYLV